MKQLITCLTVFLLSSSYSMASHILSGNIGYECLGNGDYEITIEIERDLFCGETFIGDAFDLETNVAIYSSGIQLQKLNVQRGPILDVLPENYEDCTSTNFQVCRKKTSYIFQANLPTIDQAYTITYQRCCWAEIIGNISNPAETGITITTDITPLAQTICHTQEISSVPISFLACPNTEVSIELPKIDNEGDSLVYEVCLPFRGAGVEGADGTGNTIGCFSIIPNPPCLPPYEELEFAPGYSYDDPFPTVDGFKFSNGFLEFTPSTLGHFLTGLCISEYRNGELLGRKQVPLAVISQVPMPSSIEEITALSWSIESITTSNLTLKSSAQASPTSIGVYDISGRDTRIDLSASGDNLKADISQLTSGIYIIKILEGTNSQVIRFFKP